MPRKKNWKKYSNFSRAVSGKFSSPPESSAAAAAATTQRIEQTQQIQDRTYVEEYTVVLDNAAIGKKVASMLIGTTPGAIEGNMQPVVQLSDIDSKNIPKGGNSGHDNSSGKKKGDETESAAKVVVRSSLKKHLEFQKEWLSLYDWLVYDRKRLTMQCWICRDMDETNKFATKGSDQYSVSVLQTHQGSAEHKNALKEQKRRNAIDRKRQEQAVTKRTWKKKPYFSAETGVDGDPSLGSDAADTSSEHVVFCLPPFSKSKDAVMFIPGRQCRDLLQAHGLRKVIELTPETTPYGVRELISKAFNETFSLRDYEFLNFEYTSVVPGKSVLEKVNRPMHFDGERVIEMAGQSYIYIMAQQPLPHSDINWKEILLHPQRMENLSDDEYKKTMLNVMHRLSCGKNKDGITREEEEVVNALYLNFKLNTSHQLVHIGNGFDQLVLFTEQTRTEAFTLSHGNHLDLLKTFSALYKSYYWNKIVSYVLKKITSCPICSSKYADRASLPGIPIDTIVDEIVPVGDDEDVAMLLDVPKRAVQPTTPFSSLPRTENDIKTIDGPPVKRFRGDENGDGEDDASDGDDMEYERDLESELTKQMDVDFPHTGKVLSAMYALQKKGMYCDFFITLLPSSYNHLTKTRVFGVHKAVFAATSPSIRKIQKSEVKISGRICWKAVQNVIEYAYTGKVSDMKNMSAQDVTDTQSAALALGMTIIDYLNKERPDVSMQTTKISLRKHPDALESKEDDVPAMTEECPVKKVVVEMDGFVEISKNLYFKAISPSKAIAAPSVKILTAHENEKGMEITEDNCMSAETLDVVLDDTSNTADSDALTSEDNSHDIREHVIFQEY